MIERTLFTAEHLAFRDSLRRFMAKEIAPFHEAWEDQGYVDRAVWNKAGDNGFLCMSLPEEYGGSGADLLYSVIQFEELWAAGQTGIGWGLHSEIVAPYPNVKVDSFDGLLVDYCRAHDVRAIVKGLRAVTDFDYELQMAQMNQQLSGVDTLFMSTSPEWSFVASSLVKEIATYGGDVAYLLPPSVHRRLVERIAERA